ncbi:bactofilin [Paenibacillus sp. GCM10027626]|uniref:bactofilin n=1 Tax=Paenibacillus sp. GCM10027626 TaxID=3273411 RepID=UPI003638A979
MTSTTAGNLKIIGTGQGTGGSYNNISIIGEAQLDGSLEANSFKCTGNSKINGSLTTLEFRQQGEVALQGNLAARRMKVMGELKIRGNLRGEQLLVRGMLEAAGSCEAEQLRVHGACSIGGMLNVEQLAIRLYGPSWVKEIGGRQIQVRLSRWKGLTQWFTAQGKQELTAEIIEGDDIYIEYTHAKLVRGDHVVIGPGCQIGMVEYRKTFKQNKSAIVRHHYSI